MMKRCCGLLALVTLMAVPLEARERIAIDVSPRLAFAPASIVVRTTVLKDSNNRAIEVTVDGDTYYRSSFVQLDGDDAPRIVTIELRGLPSGAYLVRATLFGSTRRARDVAAQEIHILAK